MKRLHTFLSKIVLLMATRWYDQGRLFTLTHVLCPCTEALHLQVEGPYRTLHSYKLFLGGMPLVPTKMADAQYSLSGNHWPGGPRDMLKTTSARVNSSPASLSHLQDGIFYKYVVFKHPLSL